MSDAAGERSGGRGARERILRTAVQLFARDGVQATGIAKLTETAQVSTRTLYQHFASKDELVRAYLERLESDGVLAAEASLEQAALSPRERILGLFVEVALDAAGTIRGCPLHNVTVEAAGTMPEATVLVERHKQRFAKRLIETAAEAGAQEPEVLGRRLALIFEGARALSTSLNDTRPLRDGRDLAEALLDQATQGISVR
ncbi:TetR/AcrR family transcriptional regulator [Kribbella sp. NPDC048915]|uniref:TetR/AcrR family transcriptional regulator n=1 Tax=Kribbella sp. NPDC048915 TaxID=3155148 RepID=UPI0033C5D61E